MAPPSPPWTPLRDLLEISVGFSCTATEETVALPQSDVHLGGISSSGLQDADEVCG